MNTRSLLAMGGAFLLLGVAHFAVSETPAPSAGATAASAYVFRFTTGLSKVMLDTMTFAESQSINLGQCQSTEKINGPIACTTTCQGTPLCLLIFEGPAGLQSTHLIEKLKEEPATRRSNGASPAPSTGEEAGTSNSNLESRLRSERIQIYRAN